MKQKVYTFLALLLAVIALAWKVIGDIERRYTERVFIKIQDGVEVALTSPTTGSYSMAVVDAWGGYERAQKAEGMWCRIVQGSRVCYEGDVTGVQRFTADNARQHPIIISLKIRENADFFSKYYLVIGQPP